MKTRCLIACAAALAAASSYAADAAANWENHCAACHGADGRGETKQGKRLKIKDLTDATYQSQFSDEDAFNAVKKGVVDAAGKQRMKPIEELSDDEIKALVGFVRSLKK